MRGAIVGRAPTSTHTLPLTGGVTLGTALYYSALASLSGSNSSSSKGLVGELEMVHTPFMAQLLGRHRH